MDWYFESEIDDFVVPKDQQLSDRLPSPDSWLKWGVNSPESSGKPNRYSDANLTRDRLNLDGKCFRHEVDQSIGSSVCEGLSGESLQLASFTHDQPDYQLNDISGIEQMDDIFLSSLLEDQPGSKYLHKSFCMSPESQVHPANNLTKDMVFESQSISTDEHGPRSSKYLNEHAFSSSLGWEKDNADSLFLPCNPGQSVTPVKSLLVKGLTPHEKDNTSIHVDKETSLEESVLQQLEMVMLQFTEKTRICFRDSLYRLANNSRQQHMVTQNINGQVFMEKAPPWPSCDGGTRSGRKNSMESKTNTIDRAIANLMFNNMESNAQAIPGTTIANCRNPRSTTLQGDAEVPV